MFTHSSLNLYKKYTDKTIKTSKVEKPYCGKINVIKGTYFGCFILRNTTYIYVKHINFMFIITCIIIIINIIIIIIFFSSVSCIYHVFQQLKKNVAPDSLEKTVVQNVLIHILGKTVRNDVIVKRACVTFLPDVLLSQHVSNQFRFFIGHLH